MSAKILIIDDETQILKALERFLVDLSYEVSVAGSYEKAHQLLERQIFDAAVIDLKIADHNGIELLKEIKKMQPEMVCIMMTGFASLESAIEAVKAGAYHYLTKPFRLEDLENLLSKALENRKFKQENRILKQQIAAKSALKNIIGASGPIQEIYELIEKVADTDSNVLVLGESGTGKELVARAIHYSSMRADKSLVTVNCGAIPEELLESELFGHVKGAFTGATSTRPGRFQLADCGTIFLDEIGDMSMRLQVKLLRVLQEKRFEPVGSTKTVEVDVRIIAATNKDLEKAVAENKFREDLFYRLNVIPINVPPLRARMSDVVLLIDYFLKKFADENKKPVPLLSGEALDTLKNYSWPGNVRELENLIERLVILKNKSIIEKQDLPPLFCKENNQIQKNITPTDFPEEGVDFNFLVEQLENQLIEQALKKSGGNKNRAAQLLKLNRTTLVEKMKKRNFEALVKEAKYG